MLLAAGSNAKGQLAISHDEDAHRFERCVFVPPLPSGSIVIDVACGANHTLAIVDQRKGGPSIWRAGTSSKAQCASVDADSPDFVPLDLPDQYKHLTPRSVSCLWETSIAVLDGPDEHILLSFGGNDFGDLGRGDSPPSDPQPVDLAQATGGRNTCVLKVVAGPHHVVALLDCLTDDGPQRCAVGWGASRHGQLGTDAVNKITSKPVLIYSNSTGDEKRIVDVACGNQHTVLLREDRSLELLGSNRRGQIDDTARSLVGVIKIACCWSTTYVVEGSSVVRAFGNGAHGQLGLDLSSKSTSRANRVELTGTIKGLVAGSEHVIALIEGGGQRTVVGWGWNEHGNLALGHTADILTPIQIWPPVFDSSISPCGPVGNVWAGYGTTWIAVTEELLHGLE